MKIEDILSGGRRRRQHRGSRLPRTKGIELKHIRLRDHQEDGVYIGYHGTDADFDRFDRTHSAQGIHWFANNPDVIRSGDSGAAGRGRIIKARLHINNPAGWDEYDRYMLDQLEQMGYDGLILDDNYVVFSDDQIEIVGEA